MLHCPGIGPSRLEKLRAAGIRNWQDVVGHDGSQFAGKWFEATVAECQICMEALEADGIDVLVDRLHPSDHWRILDRYLDQVTYFDIETAGLEHDAPITTIACWHRGQVHTFVEHENLDDFLDLLDDVTLLSSFNGSSFDVPRVLDAFHIPRLPCPHLDLRWLCYHHQLQGGLKRIASRLHIRRPAEFFGVDGEMAIRCWQRWVHEQDRAARELLLRYAVSDVLLLVAITDRLLERNQVSLPELWAMLPETAAAAPASGTSAAPVATDGSFGDASPQKLRGRPGRLSQQLPR